MQIFDAQHIGRQIAAARKAKNMTQSDLANQLGVSYQAVSNWERSQSLPDIDKYAQLAEVLDLDLATLIGSKQGAHTVTVVTDDGPLDSDTLVAAAPVMKPQAVTAKAANVQLSLAKLTEIAPFLSSEVLASRLEAATADPDFDAALVKLAPFVEADELEKIIRSRVGTATPADLPLLQKLAPFRNQAANDATAKALLAQGTALKALSRLLPFLTQQTVDDLFNQTAAADVTNKQLCGLAPFVSKSVLVAHVKSLLQQGESKVARSFMPFLGDDDLLGLMGN